MTHFIQGIVGPRSVLAQVEGLGLPEEVRPLDVGMGWVPMTERMLEALSLRTPEPGAADARFERFGWGVPELVAELSRGSALIYLETEYFGGVGAQLATVYVDGRRTLEACPVNEALRSIGVDARAGQDEWDTVGLSSYRRMPDE